MAASLRQSKMFHAQLCLTAARCGREKIRLVPISRLTTRQFSQLHRYTRALQRSHHANRLTSNDLKNLNCLSFVRLASTDIQPDIPSPPSPTDPYAGYSTGNTLSPEEIIPNLPDLNSLGEPTLHSVGLGSNWPPGLFQQLLEYMHVSWDLPWYAALVSCVIVVRTCLFFVMIKQQRYLGVHEKNMPEMNRLQRRINEAKSTFDNIEIIKRKAELATFTKKNDTGKFMLYSAVPLAIQGVVMCSAFFGVRKMALLPIYSMTTGGCLWFTDLTVADPYYALSIITASAMLLNLELGAESMSTKSLTPARKYMTRGLVLIVFAFTFSQPAGSVFYLCCHTTVTLAQAALLRNPKVRVWLDLPERPALISSKESKTSVSTKSIMESYNDTIYKAKSFFEGRRQMGGLINRRIVDDEQFKKAGVGPIPKTYSFNPKSPKLQLK